MAVHNNPIEINDLIDDAVKNAAARRNEALNSKEGLLSISDEEAKSVAGGTWCVPVIHGVIIKPPLTIGVVVLPPNLNLS